MRERLCGSVELSSFILSIRVVQMSAQSSAPAPVKPPKPLSSEEQIPKLFHQFLWNGYVPDKLRGCQASLMKHHMDSEWKWLGWTKDSFVSFVEEHYRTFVAIFANLKHPYQVIQLARYLVLYHFGGVTVDLDLEFFQNIEGYIKDAELVLVRAYATDFLTFVNSGGHYGQHGFKRCSTFFTNKLMASRPKNPFWINVIKNSVPRIYKQAWLPTVSQEVHWITGSFLLTDTFVAGRWWRHQRVILLPSTFLEPCRYAPMWRAITGFDGPCFMNEDGEWTERDRASGRTKLMKAVIRDHHAEDWTETPKVIPTVLALTALVVLVLLLRRQIQWFFSVQTPDEE